MSIKKAENILHDFLINENEGVLVLKGDWGIGKTFFFKKFLEKNKNCTEYSFQKYSYVSLFGISDIRELKSSIFENTVSKDKIGTKITISDIADNLESLEKVKDFTKSNWRNWSVKIGKNLPYLNPFYSVVNALNFIDPRETLICIDDFERSTLKPEEVLGIITYLREERGCKIILIFNENELAVHKEKYDIYREKVVDIELEFSPSLEECGKLIYLKKDTDKIEKILYDSCISLSIKNIRILKKIKNMSVELMEILHDLDEDIIKAYLQTLCLFTLSHLSPNSEDIPSIDFLLGRMSTVETLIDKLYSSRKEMTEKEKKWEKKLHNFGYFGTDNMDLAIFSGVKQGYFDKDEIRVLAEEKQRINDINVGKDAPNKILKEYFYGCFDDNEKEFKRLLVESIKRNIEYMGIGELHQMIVLLRDIEYPHKGITRLINLYIVKNGNKISTSNHGRELGYLTDPEIIKKINIQIRKTKIIKTLTEVIDTMSQNSWSAEDEETLLKADKDNLYNLYKERKGTSFEDAIRVTTMYLSRTTPKPEEIIFNQTVKQVLKKIQKESLMNKVRLKNLGIVLD